MHSIRPLLLALQTVANITHAPVLDERDKNHARRIIKRPPSTYEQDGKRDDYAHNQNHKLHEQGKGRHLEDRRSSHSFEFPYPSESPAGIVSRLWQSLSWLQAYSLGLEVQLKRDVHNVQQHPPR